MGFKNNCELLFLTIFWITQTSEAFDNVVKPHCPKTESNCHFQLTITTKMSMTFYALPNKNNPKIFSLIDGTTYVQGYAEHKSVLLQKIWNNTDFFPQNNHKNEENFTPVNTLDGGYRSFYAINDDTPGPTIAVYEGQTVVVNVTNHMEQESLTIHWHGMELHNTNFMDGVPGVTQCAIGPQETFTYRFIAENTGTFIYHSHLGAQRVDGIAGPLIVVPREEKRDEHSFDEEFVLMVQDWYAQNGNIMFHEQHNNIPVNHFYHDVSNLTAPDGSNLAGIRFHSALINGKGMRRNQFEPQLPLEKFQVEKGKRYKFHLINHGAVYDFRISFDEHDIAIVVTDNFDVVPTEANAVYLAPGERMQVVLKADKPNGSYWIRAETLHWNKETHKAEPFYVLAVLSYDDDESVPISEPVECTKGKPCVHVNCPFKQYAPAANITCVNIDNLKRSPDLKMKNTLDTAAKQQFLSFNKQVDKNGVRQSAINGIQYKPGVRKPEAQNKAVFEHDCALYNCTAKPCFCTQRINILLGDVIEMIFFSHLTDTENGHPSSHPIHVHGHSLQVIKVGYPTYDPVTNSITEVNQDIKCLDPNCYHATWRNESYKDSSLIPGVNLKDPPLKDSVVIPTGGYVLVRFLADNPGFWLLHCHQLFHEMGGMALVMQEGNLDEMYPPPADFPTCSSYSMKNRQFTKAIDGHYQYLVDSSAPTLDINRFYWAIIVGAIVLVITNIVVAVVAYKCGAAKPKKVVFYKMDPRSSEAVPLLYGKAA